MNTKYSEWFRVFYATITHRYNYSFDVTDKQSMDKARKFYDDGHSPMGAAYLFQVKFDTI